MPARTRRAYSHGGISGSTSSILPVERRGNPARLDKFGSNQAYPPGRVADRWPGTPPPSSCLWRVRAGYYAHAIPSHSRPPAPLRYAGAAGSEFLAHPNIRDHMITHSERHGILRELAVEPLCLCVSGWCMWPWIADGARVWVRRACWYWPGDVVVVRAGDGRWLIHRVIGGYPRHGCWRWLTQADAASRPDASRPGEQLLGKVCGGDCSVQAMRVPFAHRLGALGRFIRFFVGRAVMHELWRR